MLTLRSSGEVVGWGDNSYGQSDVPAGLSDVIAVTAGGHRAETRTLEALRLS